MASRTETEEREDFRVATPSGLRSMAAQRRRRETMGLRDWRVDQETINRVLPCERGLESGVRQLSGWLSLRGSAESFT